MSLLIKGNIGPPYKVLLTRSNTIFSSYLHT